MEEQIEVQQEGITFSSILELFKKGWKLILIVVLISLIIATSLLVIFRECFAYQEYKTQIKFSAESMRSDANWNPASYIDDVVKSDLVVREALTKCGISEQKQDEMIEDDFKKNISTLVVESYKISNEQEYPYIVEISLLRNKDFGLSKSQYSSIASELTKATIAYLQKEFRYDVTVKSLTLDYDSYNFLQLLDVLSIATEEMSSYLNNCDASIKNYKAPGASDSLSISEIKGNVDNINNRVSIITTYLINQKVMNKSTNVGSTEYETAEYNVDLLTSEITNLETRIDKYSALLEACKPEIVNQASGNVTITNNYYEFLDVYNNLQDELVAKKTRLSIWEKYKTAYSASPSTEKSDIVENMIKSVVEDYNKTLNSLNVTIDSYNDNGLGGDSIKQIKPVKMKTESKVSILIFLGCEVVVLLVSAIIALYVTKKKETK